MKRAYQKRVVRRGRTREAEQSSGELQLSFDRSEVLREMQQGLHQFAMGLGVELAQMFLEDEVVQLCGERYERQPGREATRYGTQPGVITLAGQKVPIERPRVRSARGGGEIPISVYGMAQREEAMPQAVMRRLTRGVSARDYEGVIERAAKGFGVKRSSVSRAFKKASAQKISQIRERRLDERFPVIFIDGVGYADTLMLVALGIAADGRKVVLGFREGGTENTTVCKAMLEELIERGLDSTKPTLFVLDGSKALRRAVCDVWGDRALVQRCRAHKKRNIRAHVADKHWPEVERMLARAWSEPVSARALKQLQTLASYLDRISPDAASSLREGMEETLTVTRLGIPTELSVHLHTTNPIESAFSMNRQLTGRVKRWRDGGMKHRWCATALVEAEARFRRIKGFRQMEKLITLLDATIPQSQSARKTA